MPPDLAAPSAPRPDDPPAPLPASPSLATPPLTPADHAAFATALTQLNLRHLQWFAAVGNIFLWGVFLFLWFHPLPLGTEAGYLDGALCLSGAVHFVLAAWIRRRPVLPAWAHLVVLSGVTIFLGLTNAYFFAMIPAYGYTSVYIIGILGAVVFFRLSPRVIVSLLLLNHAVFLSLLFTYRPQAPSLIVSTAIDYTGAALLAGFAGWLLYRAQWENFCQARIILERNRELARLHQLELSEKIAARLGEEKARLEVLRYQLNPHFLFNALTSVCSQLPPSLSGARAAIERLTDFCQLTLFKPAHDEHPTVGDELKLLRAYLDIEKSRWGDLLTVELDLAPEVTADRIPSLLLLPLVENALKYGRATSRGAMAIRVTAARDASSALVITIANTGEWLASPGRSSVPSLGIGLENLRQRLARYYPGRHTFTHDTADGWVTARLRLG